MNDEFLVELQKLLDKYKAMICFEVSECSDTYGLSEERMAIYRHDPRAGYKLVKKVPGYGIDGSDL